MIREGVRERERRTERMMCLEGLMKRCIRTYRSTRPEKGGKKTRERTRKKRVVHHGLGKRVINVT